MNFKSLCKLNHPLRGSARKMRYQYHGLAATSVSHALDVVLKAAMARPVRSPKHVGDSYIDCEQIAVAACCNIRILFKHLHIVQTFERCPERIFVARGGEDLRGFVIAARQAWTRTAFGEDLQFCDSVAVYK